MYLYPYKIGKGKDEHVLGSLDIDSDTDRLLSNFGFQKSYVDPENKNEVGFTKIYAEYEKADPSIIALKVFTPGGNKLEWNDTSYKKFRCACYIGLFGLPEPGMLDDKSKDVVKAFSDLRKKYDNLEDVVFDKMQIALTVEHYEGMYKKKLPDKDFFVYRVGRDRKNGHVMTTGAFDNETNFLLTNFGFHKWYVDPANKDEKGFVKVYTQFEIVGGGLSAFKVLTLDGNKLDYTSRDGEHFKCAGHIGFLGFPPKNKFNGEFNELTNLFSDLTKKYHRGLEDVVKKREPEKKFYS